MSDSPVKAHYHKKREAGICVQSGCDRPAAGGVRCAECAASVRAVAKERYARRRGSGECAQAGCKSAPGVNPKNGKPYSFCEEHRARARDAGKVAYRKRAASAADQSVSGGTVSSAKEGE